MLLFVMFTCYMYLESTASFKMTCITTEIQIKELKILLAAVKCKNRVLFFLRDTVQVNMKYCNPFSFHNVMYFQLKLDIQQDFILS